MSGSGSVLVTDKFSSWQSVMSEPPVSASPAPKKIILAAPAAAPTVGEEDVPVVVQGGQCCGSGPFWTGSGSELLTSEWIRIRILLVT